MSERYVTYSSRRRGAPRRTAVNGAGGRGHRAATSRVDPGRRARGRRRRLLVGLLLGGLLLAVAVVAPALRQAVRIQFGLPLRYADIIRERAAVEHLDPAFVAAVIDAETKFVPSTSSAGAEGLMQILPQTAMFLARRSGAQTFTVGDLGTPRVNITYGCYYLRYLLDEYRGSRTLALAAYNGGETNVNRWLASARAGGRDFTVASIPFSETRDYVVKVLGLQRSYRTTYPRQLGL